VYLCSVPLMSAHIGGGHVMTMMPNRALTFVLRSASLYYSFAYLFFIVYQHDTPDMFVLPLW